MLEYLYMRAGQHDAACARQSEYAHETCHLPQSVWQCQALACSVWNVSACMVPYLPYGK